MTSDRERDREDAAPRLSAFAAAMAAARAAAGISQQTLGEAIDRKQGSVSRYEAGLLEPDHEAVFAMERALGLKPGALSHYLGYLPLRPGTDLPLLPYVDVVERDPFLDPQAKTMLISVYRSVARLADRARAADRLQVRVEQKDRGDEDADEEDELGQWWHVAGFIATFALGHAALGQWAHPGPIS